MNKRKGVHFDVDQISQPKKQKESERIKKHSLDSDEEDENEDAYNVLDDDDIEGEEDGVAGNEGGQRTTAFNMREEMEEGYFDKDGHYVWNKEREIRDNWLDNIDWEQIRPSKAGEKGLGDDSDTDSEDGKNFNEIACYKNILSYLEPKENITKALQRLGGSKKKLSSVERLKMKKAGLLNIDNDKLTKLTELANDLLNQTGNMDIYQETYEMITDKIELSEEKSKPKAEELDMYAEDFDLKEKQRLEDPGPSKPNKSNDPKKGPNQLMWEFKWAQNSDQIEGPNTTEQMQKWVEDGYFKTGVWVRKVGQDQFYASNRIDFEIYLS